MAGIAQNRQKRLVFIVVPQVRTKKQKREKRKRKQINKKTHENE